MKKPGSGPPPSIFVDFTGHVFGRLTAIRAEYRRGRGRWHWLCRCQCGAEKMIRESYLVNERTRSCGCLSRDNVRARLALAPTR